MFEQVFENVKRKTPLVHTITNYVTVNDCANIALACGGSPIMADEEAEAADITAICHSLVLNIGTLNRRTINAMVIAGKRANELGHPVVFDPVGAGASQLRTETASMLMDTLQFAVIRGNISEIKAIAAGSGTTKGVDADAADAVTEENLTEMTDFVKSLSRQTGAVIAVTGAIDLVASADRVTVIRNGTPMMSKVTGTGCMLSAMTGVFCGANPENLYDAASCATTVMGLAGEIGMEKTTQQGGGTASLRINLIDAVSNMGIEQLNGGMKLETR